MATKTAAKLQISMSFRDAGYERGLKKARRDTRQTQSAIQRLTPSISGLAGAAAAAGAALGAMFAARKLFQAGRKAVALFQEQEDAVEGLRAALDATGKAGQENLDLITDAAAALQRQTRAADETVIDATATLAQLAPALNAQELASAQSAIVGIADTFLQGNIKNAAVLVGKAVGSSTNALVRYGIEIDTAASQSEKLQQLLESTGSFFEVSQAKAKTFAGQIEQLKNFFGDLGEEVGESLVPPLREFSQFLLDSRDDFKRMTEAFTEQLSRMSEAVRTFLQAASVDFGLAAEQVGVIIGSKFASGFSRAVIGIFKSLSLTQFLGPVGEFIDEGNLAIAAFETLGDTAEDSANKAIEALQILAGASASGRAELQRIRNTGAELAADIAQYGTGIGAAFAFARRQAEGLANTASTLPGVAGDGEPITPVNVADIVAPTVRAPREIDQEAVGATLRDSDVLRDALPEINVEDFAGGLSVAGERAAMQTAERMERVWDDFGRDTRFAMQGIGVDLVQGLISGTLSVGDLLKRTMIRLATSFILGPLSGALGIFSPSRVTRVFGEQIGAGLVRGMDSMRGAVESASQRLAQAATPQLLLGPNLATVPAGTPAAVASVREETPPIEVNISALFDPYKEASSAGGQAFITEGTRNATKRGFRR